MNVSKIALVIFLSLSSVMAYSSPLKYTDMFGMNAASGNLHFVNHTGQTIKVVINNSSSVGAPIPPNGLNINYMLVQGFCLSSGNLNACKTAYLINGKQFAEDIFNASTGEVISYEVTDPAYDVQLSNDASGVLRTVTLNHK